MWQKIATWPMCGGSPASFGDPRRSRASKRRGTCSTPLKVPLVALFVRLKPRAYVTTYKYAAPAAAAHPLTLPSAAAACALPFCRQFPTFRLAVMILWGCLGPGRRRGRPTLAEFQGRRRSRARPKRSLLLLRLLSGALSTAAMEQGRGRPGRAKGCATLNRKREVHSGAPISY